MVNREIEKKIRSCDSLEKLERLHDALCKIYPAWERHFFTDLICEQEGYLLKELYWNEIYEEC